MPRRRWSPRSRTARSWCPRPARRPSRSGASRAGSPSGSGRRAGRAVDSRALWADFRPDRAGFAPPRQWGIDRLAVDAGEAIVAATPDEADPTKAAYAADVPPWWRYEGRFATQYWRARAQEGLVA